MRWKRLSMVSRVAVLAGVALTSVVSSAGGAAAQAIKDLKTPGTPLVLKAQGSFFIGGEKSDQTNVELGNLGPAGHIAVNQMYVRYMVPQGGDGNVPVVMVHGATLTGKSWETTPDGRMGWDEYFVRKGHPNKCRIRWAAGDRDSIRPSSTTSARAPVKRVHCPPGCDSATKSCGRTSVSGRNPASRIRTVNSRSLRWLNSRNRVCPT